MDPLRPAIDRLHEGRLRVWSLVVTVFGDAVAPRGGRISGLRLQVLLERLSVEPGTLRTALSRLARDGWIEREKEGRMAHYRLSARGIREFAPATERIYAAPKAPETWTLGTGTPPPGAFATQGAWLAPGRVAGDALAVTGGLAEVPQSVRGGFLTPTWAGELAALAADLETVSALDPDPLTAMAARTLLIHRWRRIVLAGADLPDAIRPEGLPGRAEVARAYARLVAPSELWLDDTALPEMATPDGDPLAKRFG